MKILVLSRNKNLYSTSRIINSAEKLGHEVRVVDYLRCYMNITSKKPTVIFRGEKLENYDAVITDVFHRGRRPFTKNNIRGFKFKKVGARRLVFARVDIGHADSSRYYWKSGWKEGSPPYIGVPTPTNPDQYYVRYWYKAWQDIISGKPLSYVYGIYKQGFDGVVIDGISSYRFFEGAQ